MFWDIRNSSRLAIRNHTGPVVHNHAGKDVRYRAGPVIGSGQVKQVALPSGSQLATDSKCCKAEAIATIPAEFLTK